MEIYRLEIAIFVIAFLHRCIGDFCQRLGTYHNAAWSVVRTIAKRDSPHDKVVCLHATTKHFPQNDMLLERRAKVVMRSYHVVPNSI